MASQALWVGSRWTPGAALALSGVAIVLASLVVWLQRGARATHDLHKIPTPPGADLILGHAKFLTCPDYHNVVLQASASCRAAEPTNPKSRDGCRGRAVPCGEGRLQTGRGPSRDYSSPVARESCWPLRPRSAAVPTCSGAKISGRSCASGALRSTLRRSTPPTLPPLHFLLCIVVRMEVHAVDAFPRSPPPGVASAAGDGCCKHPGCHRVLWETTVVVTDPAVAEQALGKVMQRSHAYSAIEKVRCHAVPSLLRWATTDSAHVAHAGVGW